MFTALRQVPEALGLLRETHIISVGHWEAWWHLAMQGKYWLGAGSLSWCTRQEHACGERGPRGPHEARELMG